MNIASPAFPTIDLREFEHLPLQQVVDCIPVGAMLVDDCGIFRHVNKELSDGLGYKQSELSGNSIDFILPKEFRASHKALIHNYFKNPTKRQMGYGKKLYALHKSGKKIPIEIGLNPVQTNAGILVLATLVDISPRLKADRVFQQTVSVAPYGVLIVNAEGMIELVNQQLCQSFGYAESEMIGQPLAKLIPNRYRDQHESLRKGFQRSPAVRMMGEGRDLTALHKDGTEFPVEIGLSPLHVDDDDPDGMTLVSLTDITPRKRMEMELRKTNTNLEEFTYVASHDLRSPLRGIANLLEWISEDLGPDTNEDVSNNLERMRVRINRMDLLIDNLLAYAKAGQVDSNLEHINVEDMLHECLELVDVPQGFSITLKLDVDSLFASRTPLETVLRNLISNAIKHHDKSEGNIVISCAEEGSRCQFSVSDDGPGISASAMERVFRLFQTATSSERRGSGIGLSISRRLAEVHGGELSACANSSGRGVTFLLLWPRYIRRDTYDQ